LAIISEPFFDIAFWHQEEGISYLRDTNIFYTLFLGVVAIAIYGWMRDKLMLNSRFFRKSVYINILSYCSAVPPIILAHFFTTDYSWRGVLLIFLIYIMDPNNQINRCIAIAIGMLLLYFNNIFSLSHSLVAVVLIALYNGELEKNNVIIKWGFYFFYPLHIGALIVVRTLFLGI